MALGSVEGTRLRESPQRNFTLSRIRILIISYSAALILPSEMSQASISASGTMSASWPVLIPRPQHMSSKGSPFHRLENASATNIEDSLWGVALPSEKPGMSSGYGFAGVRTDLSSNGEAHAFLPEALY